MRALKLRAEHFCRTVLDKRIADGGLLFPDKPAKILFYAGPSDEVLKKIPGAKTHWGRKIHQLHWKVAADEATRLGAHRLDEVSIFSYLRSALFEEELKGFLGKKASLQDIDDATKLIWDETSDKLAHTDFEEAATFVCGADENSSFCLKEMFGMLDGTHLKVLNKRPADLFRGLRKLGKDEVQRVMSMTYLFDLRAHAMATKDPKDLAFYKRERLYFLKWRLDKKAAFKAKPKAERLAFRKTRGEILKQFNGTAPASPKALSGSAMMGLPKPANIP